MIPFFIRLHFKFTFTFTFLHQKLPVFCNFCYRLTILLLFPLKLRPDVAPTAWRRNLFCVPTLPSLHRHAFSSPSYRFLIPLVSLSHPPRVTFPSYIFITFSASL